MSGPRFYVEERTLQSWEVVAHLNLGAEGAAGTLARALSTLVDAYRHARSTTDGPGREEA